MKLKLQLNKNAWFGLAVFLASSLLAAAASPQEEVIAAATALGSQTNYSWKTSIEFGLMHATTTRQGSTSRDGYTRLSLNFISQGAVTNLAEVLIRGTNAAIKTPEQGWRSAADILRDPGSRSTPAWGVARTALNFPMPASMAARLAAQAQGLQSGTNGISGVLTGEGAAALLGGSPAATNRQVAVTFWITDGKLAKVQWHATGRAGFNGGSQTMNRTTTTEITDVNSTQVEAPDEARKILK